MTGEGLVAASSCEQARAASGSPVDEGDKQRCEPVGLCRETASAHAMQIWLPSLALRRSGLG